MAEAITTNGFRQKIAKHFHDGSSLSQTAYMAFGDGGHNPDGTAKTPDPSRIDLYHELLRKPLEAKVQEDAYSTTGTGKILAAELVGESISEAALIDEDGDMCGYITFAPKIKEGDETYSIHLRLRF